MRKHNVPELIEYDDKRFLPKVLMNEPGYRLVILNLRSGQQVPEHATNERVTIYALRGQVTFFEDKTPVDLRAGEVLCLDGGVPHSVLAHEDSSLLVIAAGSSAPAKVEPLDLRSVPRPQRHPLVFDKFDRLKVGESFELINDHDPIPLNRQMETMRPGQVEWSYITRGPAIFHIQVRRLAPMNGKETPVVARSEAELHSIR